MGACARHQQPPTTFVSYARPQDLAPQYNFPNGALGTGVRIHHHYQCEIVGVRSCQKLLCPFDREMAPWPLRRRSGGSGVEATGEATALEQSVVRRDTKCGPPLATVACARGDNTALSSLVFRACMVPASVFLS